MSASAAARAAARRAPAVRRAAALAAGVMAAGTLSGVPAAHALVVSSDADGLQMREPNNVVNAVKLSLVDAGGLKYRIEMGRFGGRGIDPATGCQTVSTEGGVDVVLCDRITPVVSQVSFGPFRDTLETEPGFPDPIHAADGGIGPDLFRLGAGDDVSRAARDDTVLGLLGDDDLTSTGGRVDGGEGDDRLHALGRGGGVLVGGAGDDTLTADPEAAAIMVGGEGTDSFAAGGARASINSRDGIAEPVSCGLGPDGRRGVAVVDLVDVPGDAELLAGGCASVDRAPRGEKTAARLASRALRLRRGKVAVRVRCATRTRCRGELSVTAGGRTRSARYAIKGKRTETIRVAGRSGRATVRIAEGGVKGPRTISAILRVQR